MSRKPFVFLVIFAVISLCLSLAGCSVDEESFPELEFTYDTSETGISETSLTEDNYNDLHEISVALPLSDETVTLLMHLYYAKCNGMIGEEMNGSDISIEYLEAINTPWIVHSITTANTGASVQNLQDLSEDGAMPDIFLASDINDVTGEHLNIPLDSYLSNYSALNSSSVYLGALEALRDGNEHYGIPFYSTVYMLAGNRDFLPESGVPAFTLSPEELLDHISSIDSYSYDDGVSITRFYDADTLEGLVDESFIEALEDDQLSEQYDSYGADPRVSRTCGMWLMNSGEFDTWNSYYPDALYFVMLPTANVNAVVYPLCISSTCDDADFATDFASFICFDKDAQMLIHRVEELRGFFPSIPNQGVWVQMSDDPLFGSQTMLYEQYMNTADYVVAED